MKSRVLLSLCPALLALLVVAGAQNVEASDVRFSVGVGHDGYHHREFRTVDPLYNTWYPDGGTSYGYSDDLVYPDTYYSTPYVYSTPSVEFDSWYGGGYRNHGGNFGGNRGGYSGGVRSSGAGVRSSGGAHSSGGHR